MSWDRLKLMRAAARVARNHVMHTNHAQTVGEHTFGVIALVYEVVAPRVPSSNLLLSALYHDATEAVRGDPPAPVVWHHRELAVGYESADDSISESFNLPVLDLTEWEEQVLRFCDSFEYVLYAIEEVDSGNLIFLPRAKGALSSILRNDRHLCTPAAENLVRVAERAVTDRYTRFGTQLETTTHGWPG